MNELTVTLVSLLLLTLSFLTFSTITRSQITSMLGSDLSRLSTIKELNVSSRAYLVTIEPFSLKERCSVAIYATPYEVKTFSRKLEELIRFLASNDAKVALIIIKGPKLIPPNYVPNNVTVGYCWGPACPPKLNLTKMVYDNPEGSYEFMLKVFSTYGPIGIVFTRFLYAHSLLYSNELKRGVWLNDKFLFLGDPWIPTYVYATMKASNLLLTLCEGQAK